VVARQLTIGGEEGRRREGRRCASAGAAEGSSGELWKKARGLVTRWRDRGDETRKLTSAASDFDEARLDLAGLQVMGENAELVRVAREKKNEAAASILRARTRM
jgi:hypothetical protein